MKKIKSIVLCLLALLFILTGCSGKSDLIGTYQGEVDFSPALSEAMMEIGLEEEDLDSLTLPIPLTFLFHEDGTYSLQVDAEAGALAARSYIENICKILPEKLADQTGLTLEELDALFVEEVGIDFSEYIADVFSQLEPALISSLEESNEAGVYKTENGKLYTAEEKSGLSDENCVAYSYTLEGDTLTLLSRTGGDDETEDNDSIDALFPAIFTKQ